MKHKITKYNRYDSIVKNCNCKEVKKYVTASDKKTCKNI